MHSGVHSRVLVSPKLGHVTTCCLRPKTAKLGLLLAHGAGADMHHAFMESLAHRLAENHVATLRFQFPYTEAGKRRPDHPKRLLPTIEACYQSAKNEFKGLPLVVGGKSMGGRMTSLLQATRPLPEAIGLVFVGFPLHPPKRIGTERALHLAQIKIPMLFLQGTRDALANRDLMRKECAKLGDGATLTEIEGADHGFHVLKRSGRSDPEVLHELAKHIATWGMQLI